MRKHVGALFVGMCMVLVGLLISFVLLLSNPVFNPSVKQTAAQKQTSQSIAASRKASYAASKRAAIAASKAAVAASKEALIARSKAAVAASKAAIAKKVKKERNSAKDEAYDLILDNLKSPSSAELIDEKIIANDQYNRYLVYVEVDAPNSFGTMLRKKYYVIIRVLDDSNYSYSRTEPYMDIDEADFMTNGQMIATLKDMNDWGKKPSD